MGWFSRMNENVRKGVRNWLQIQPSGAYNIMVNEVADFELNAIKNRIWYRGDGNEIEQLYQQAAEYADRYKFWASKCTPGMEMRKIHTGLPGMIIRVLAPLVLTDMNKIDLEKEEHKQIWREVEKKNHFEKKLERTLRDVLCVGDGAWKITLNTGISPYPILQWYSGEYIEVLHDGDMIREIAFKTQLRKGKKEYVLHERYGFGYVKNELYYGDKLVELSEVECTKNLKDWNFDKNLILAQYISVYESTKFQGRGGSVFDGKHDSFDALDEAWSQWMDALRAGRAKTYIPESYAPRDPNTGMILKPNPFDNRFIAGDDNMGEDGKNTITTEQPAIPHDSYAATYITALDLCLQGIISPSTLGIDTKKLDNAEAQREKEKTTLYTRNAIVEALQEVIPELISKCVNCYRLAAGKNIEDVSADVTFGEYANPSFESQVETVSKAKSGGIMSITAAVDELYGDSRDEVWKKEEVARIKEELGIASVEDPALNLEGVRIDESGDWQESLENEQAGI